jgi:DNA polymerase-4
MMFCFCSIIIRTKKEQNQVIFSPPSFLPSQNPYQWLFLDLNSYFASVEQQDRPALRGKPIAITPLPSESTCAIAASYEAKAYGIKTGTKIYDARRMCPELICVPARHDIYVEYHHKILAEVVRHTPINKICSIDELSSRLPPNKQSLEAATALSARIKDGIRQNVGEAIKCSIGVAPNAFLAKIATDMMKPDGLVILDEGNMIPRLFALKLTDLPGINVNMKARLMKSGVYSVEQFWNLSPKHARAVWGSVEGERFWYKLHGYDVPDTVTHTSMIGHSRILDPELRAPEVAKLVARRLTIKAAGRLRRTPYYASDFALSVREAGDGGQKFSMACRMSPAHDNYTFLDALDGLWGEMMRVLNPWKIKKINVALYNLHERGQITPDLFEEVSDVHQEVQAKHETLSNLMDKINQKYGSEAIRLGVSPKTQAGYVGTKIAFLRSPDLEEFNE